MSKSFCKAGAKVFPLGVAAEATSLLPTEEHDMREQDWGLDPNVGGGGGNAATEVVPCNK